MIALQPLPLTHAGTELIGQLAVPEGTGPFPAVLVMYNALGLGRQVKEAALELAARGWLAIATDMYGGGVWFADPDEAGAGIGPLWQDPGLLRARVVAWHDALRARPDVDPARLAAIGYCFGGQCVLELARSGADLRAVVSYHGVLKTHAPALPGTVKPHVAIYTGGKDPYAPREDVEALRAELVGGGAPFTITEFAEALHSFTDVEAMDRPGMRYDPVAHRVSWAGTLALLDLIA